MPDPLQRGNDKYQKRLMNPFFFDAVRVHTGHLVVMPRDMRRAKLLAYEISLVYAIFVDTNDLTVYAARCVNTGNF